MAQWLKLYAMHTASTKPGPCYYTTLLNADVLNFYLTLDLLQIAADLGQFVKLKRVYCRGNFLA